MAMTKTQLKAKAKQDALAKEDFLTKFSHQDEIGEGLMPLWVPSGDARLEDTITCVLSSVKKVPILEYKNKFLHSNGTIYEMLTENLLKVDKEYDATMIIVEPADLDIEDVEDQYSDNIDAVNNWKKALRKLKAGDTKGVYRTKVIDIIQE